jgi:septum formation protein
MNKIMKNLPQITALILASQSPRRVQILQQMGIESHVMPADIDETQLLGESPTDYVLRLAGQKACFVAENCHQKRLNLSLLDLPILAADTTVALGDVIFGKPTNDAEAVAILNTLSNKTHQVHTAIALWVKGRVQLALSTTQVTMMPLTDAMIASYIATGEHRDKAGSYGIQGLAGSWIAHINGSYTGVMGLPMYETMQLLNQNGFN